MTKHHNNFRVKFFSIILSCLCCIHTSFVFAKKAVDSNQSANTMPPAFVETIKVQTSQKQETLTATGSLIAVPGIIIKPEIAGRVTKIFFQSGDEVTAGTPLIELYPDIIQAQLQQAQAELKLNQLNYERYAKLYKTHTISQADYDKSKADLDSSLAKVSQISANLSQTVIKAPFSGKLGINQINIGQYITSGDNIVSLEALDPIYVDFSLPETYLSKLALQQKINIKSDAFPGTEFSGKLVAIDPLIDKNTRGLKLRAEILNHDKKLLPGAFAEVSILVGNAENVIKIPQTAIIYDPNGNYVYKVIDSKVQKAIVKLGERDTSDIVILQGLNIGDEVVTAGQLKIPAPNMPVVVMNKKPAKL